MTASQYSIVENPTENFFQILTLLYIPASFSDRQMDATAVLFLELPDVQLHYDPMFDSLYIICSYRFYLYFFGRRDFSVPLFHPAFNPSVPYFTIPLHVAHPTPPPPLVPVASVASLPASPA